MILELNKIELSERIKKNNERLHKSYYQIDEVFQPKEYDWPGDKEGRALLAFVSHYKISGAKNPCMEPMIEKLAEKTNKNLYFGPEAGDIIFEQQLSGHSWYLRGLCEYYEQFGGENIKKILKSTVENLYYPTIGKFKSYPIERPSSDGGVSGHSALILNGWNLSSDVGCAFMSIDGLSHYYKITRDAKTKLLLDEMTDCFCKIDKFSLKAQTHCSLTAARGMLRMYSISKEEKYIQGAQDIFTLYINKGMTYTYQNFNWWGRGDTWTEPCAIIDSLMVAVTLYKITGHEEYRKIAARIFHNGFATLQRPNGGAGTDTTISKNTHILKPQMYEAFFCCTMRLAEGLWFIVENQDLLSAETEEKLKKDEFGRYTNGDIIYAQIPENMEKYAEAPLEADGIKLFPIIKLYKLKNEQETMRLEQKIIF